MKIKSANFVISNTDISKCPKADKAEFAFIGRSNVGKSSLINCLTERKSLAKTSSTPGKTQLINHFEINNNWYLVDLPGYGYAKVSKTSRSKWGKMIEEYLKKRENLLCTFVLVDSRHEPQKVDMEFMNWMGENSIPFVIIFTKSDKQSHTKLQSNIAKYRKIMRKNWEELPTMIATSSDDGRGREDVLDFIEEVAEGFMSGTGN
ncbi:ribosome biogenesis GTP-binding protein YihA/YsxC [Persicobacter sp. CCB-QB2]|uniref:ribosome biogenesis GTP-binding protein YihA/YsxC n=1 Tax=Persicobacter sp. CCB-QB2 TaxID=1561025 RepID=UPI0006A9BC5C|nr:ribosome biogenesis GTP-binding protein YihA/YsxC [Persicobacter sp. CCB-QB2]